MFCEFEIAVYLSLRERICSPKEFAPLRTLLLLELIEGKECPRIFLQLLETSFYLLEKSQEVYRNFLFELFWHIIEHLEYS